MTRIAFELAVRPERLDEYLERHDPVTPAMLRALADAGMRNYSIFHAGGGRMIGCYEVDDEAATSHALSGSEAAARWDVEMTPFFLEVDGEPGRFSRPLDEVFNLERQLADVERGARG